MDIFCLLLADLYDAVGDKSGGDTVGDTVTECHEDSGKECRNCFGQIVPVNIPERGNHHASDNNQYRSGSSGRNSADQRREKGAQCKADSSDDGSETGAPSCSDAGSAFHVGRRVGSTEDSADGSCRRVGKQGLVHFGFEAIGLLQGTLVFLIENAALSSSAKERSQGIKRIGHGEGKDRDQYHREPGYVGKQRRKTLCGEDCAKGGRKGGCRIHKADAVSQLCYSEGDSDDGCRYNGDQNSAADVFDGQHNGKNKTDQEDPKHRRVEGCDSGNRQGRLGFIRAELDHAYVQETEIRDESADTSADRQLQGFRDGFDDHFAHFRYGDQDVEQTADEYHRHCLLPGEAETETHRVGKEGVQSHTGRLSIRNVGEQSHDQCTDNGGDDRCKENSAPLHSGCRQHGRVDGDDIRHRKKGRDAGGDLCGYGGVVFFQFKKLFHENKPPDLIRVHSAKERRQGFVVNLLPSFVNISLFA